MDAVRALLPSDEGLLPKWMLLVSAIAALNSLQNLLTVNVTKKIYSKRPTQVTALQARTSALWNFTSAVVRFQCAYNIHNKAIYDATLCTYLIAFFHFSTEFLFYRTTQVTVPAFSPVVVSTVSLLWMYQQYSFYVAP
ncbi:ergosterol biosynthesis protein [Tulasnella sp. JGI-2019a]|nr:ergosterol biosynthesis protein [Tulasnella sp. JGI-2019a]KAG9010453.1 ergosterol biosynthesis protein [Tulasnella sp. JGI-2019a]